ncbi:MAG TPA: PQQ-binding-like beta-propeller repeat protein [Thermoanaerobaculia bacterium]|nr:PQQ-binding-like beta-propeller repeat protein [Thermoanaerobaculia bacterium]
MDGGADPRRIRACRRPRNGGGARGGGDPDLKRAAVAIVAGALAVRAPIRPPAPPLPVPVRPRPAQRFAWPQFGFDAAHSGVNPFERSLGRANAARLRRRFRAALPSVADGAPAYLSEVPAGDGTLDILFVCTKDGRLDAVDAATGAVQWERQPAAGPRYTTSSPAIDPSWTRVYAYGLDGFVHRYRVEDGAEESGDGWPQLATRKPDVEKGSSALAIATDRAGRSFLYAANGGYPGDAGDYQGHVTAIDLASGAQRVFNAACSSRPVHFDETGNAATDCAHVQSAMWARAGAVYSAAADRVFVATGNGDFDGVENWGDSVLAIAPDASALLDSYTPPEFQHLQDVDADLGSSDVCLFRPSSGANLGVEVGKDGVLRVLRVDDLSGAGGPGHLGGELQKIGAPGGQEVLTLVVSAPDSAGGEPWIFVANDAGVSGYQWDAGAAALVLRWTVAPGASSPVFAGGLLFVARSGLIRALDPSTGDTVWSDSEIGGIHWQTPIVAKGNVYIEDEAGFLTAYSVDGK